MKRKVLSMLLVVCLIFASTFSVFADNTKTKEKVDDKKKTEVQTNIIASPEDGGQIDLVIYKPVMGAGYTLYVHEMYMTGYEAREFASTLEASGAEVALDAAGLFIDFTKWQSAGMLIFSQYRNSLANEIDDAAYQSARLGNLLGYVKVTCYIQNYTNGSTSMWFDARPFNLQTENKDYLSGFSVLYVN